MSATPEVPTPPDDGGCVDYDGEKGTCAERGCTRRPCKGECGCEACGAAYSDVMSSRDD